MPDLTAEAQDEVVFYLGYPAKVLVKDSTHFNRILQERLEDLSVETISRVSSLLALIKETRTKLDATRDDSNVNKVGEIGLDPKYADKYIQKNYKRYVRELSETLDITIRGTSGLSVKTVY